MNLFTQANIRDIRNQAERIKEIRLDLFDLRAQKELEYETLEKMLLSFDDSMTDLVERDEIETIILDLTR